MGHTVMESDLVTQLRERLDGLDGLTEKKMMGGHCFLLHGNMIGGSGCNEAGASRFMLRIGKDNVSRAESLPGGEPLVKGGRRMGGMYLVDPDLREASLSQWLALAVGNARSLPPKS
jgi:TfoX/Sxy family transcriptional regulator of competence genes